jgi:hypothetical protein
MASHDCPAWCQSNHANGTTSHLGRAIGDEVFVTTVQDPDRPAPRILIQGLTSSAHLFLSPDDATRLAVLCEQTGGSTLAGLIRRAVAVLAVLDASC